MRTQLETRMLVVYALDGMLEDTPYGRVTVSALCERVGISRAAFYRYFPTLNDVPNWLWGHILEGSLGQIGPDCSFYEGHLRCFEHLLSWRDFFGKVFRDEGVNSPVKLTCRSVLDLYLETAARNGTEGTGAAELLQVEFYNEGASAMTRKWAVGGMRQSPREMAACFDSAAPAHLKRMLRAR